VRYRFDQFSSAVTRWAGSTPACISAAGVVVAWAITGPLFDYSDTWQLVINTGTTVVTFLMVFLIQRSQNRDGLAIQLKLDELISAVKGASNRLINAESLTEDELSGIQKRFEELSESRSVTGDEDP
jgi:low affinity Fe/Cu permease